MKHLSLAFIALTLASCGGGTDTPVNESPVEAAEIVNPFEPINGGMQEAITEPPVTVPQDTPVDALIEPVFIADPVQPVEADPEPQLVDESQIPNDLIISPVMTSQRFREEWRGSENPRPFVIADIQIQWEPLERHTYALVVDDDVEDLRSPGFSTLELEYPGLLESFDYSQIPTIWVRMCVPSACYDAIAVDRQPVADVQPVAIEYPDLQQPTGTVTYKLTTISYDVGEQIEYVQLETVVSIDFLDGLEYSVSLDFEEWIDVSNAEDSVFYSEIQDTNFLEYPAVRIRACNSDQCAISEVL